MLVAVKFEMVDLGERHQMHALRTRPNRVKQTLVNVLFVLLEVFVFVGEEKCS